MSSAPLIQPGTRLADRYQIERELGRGGMATVWLARDERLEREVAIKVLRAELAGSIGVARFLREIRLTAGLRHPNIVPILDSGVLAGPDGTSLPWYVMPYLAGESLGERLHREGPLPIAEAVRITDAVGRALAAAHRQGIVHRDIKPGNVILSGDGVFVLDFGIGKALVETGAERLTRTGLALGTPAYMSPEQMVATEVDARSDQYSLATMLYEMLAGEPPFSGPSTQAVVARRLAEPARPLRSVRSTVSPSLEQAVLRALERAPADRFPDINAFLEAIRRPGGVSRSRTRILRVAGVAVLALAIATGIWLLVSSGSARAHAPDRETLALYVRGVRGYDQRTPEGIAEAAAALSAAIARDSGFAPAWTALAKTYTRAEEREFAIPGVPRDSLLRRAVSAVNRSVLLDPESPDAWLTQAIVSARVDPTDFRGALRSIRKSLALDSTQPVTWHFLARFLAETGDLDRGLEAWRRSVTLGPAYSQGLAFLALAHYWRRQFDSAARWTDSALAVEPNYLLGRTSAAQIAVERGDFSRAEAEFRAAQRLTTGIEFANTLAGQALALARAGKRPAAQPILARADAAANGYRPTPLHTAVYLAHAYAAMGQPERALTWLGRYEIPRDLHFQLHLRCDPPLEALHSLPRFRALLLRPPPRPGTGC